MAHRPQPPDDALDRSDAQTARRPEKLLDGADLVIAVAVATVSFGVYFITLAPGLLKGTSGEFQTLAAAPGYAHPAGSPVYVLLARLAAVAPGEDAARSVNLLSAVAGALAVGLLYLLARSLVDRRWVSVAGAAALAASPTFWSQAIVAGPYTSANVLMVAILLALSAFERSGQSRWLFAAVWLTAMGPGIHAGVVLLAPALVLLVIIGSRRRIVDLAVAIFATAAGLAVLLAAFWLVDRADPPTSYFRTVIGPSRSVWGLEADDLDEFHERVRLSLSAPQYGDRLFCKPPAAIGQKAVDYLANVPREFPPLWLALALGGVVWLARRSWKMTLLLLVTFATHLVLDLGYDSPDVHLLYLATYVPMALFGASGLALVGDVWRAVSSGEGPPRHSPAALGALLGILGLTVVVSPMWFSGAWNDEGRRDCWAPPEAEPFRVAYSASFHREVRYLVDDLEDDAVLFVGWSELYPCYYVAHVEQGRTDMVFIHDYPQPFHFELADSALGYVESAVLDRPVYFTHVVDKVERRFELKPVRRGHETLYRVGPPIPPKAVNDG